MKNNTNEQIKNANEELIETNNNQEGTVVESFLKNNKNMFIGIIAAVIIVVFVGVYWFNASSSKSEKASLYLSRILPYYEQDEYETALKGDNTKKIRGEAVIGLDKIVEDYKGTDAGKLAAMYAGICNVNLNKASQAKEDFEIALGSNSFVIMQGANAGMGQISEMEGKLQEASDYYSKAADYAIDKETKARYTLYSGICLEKNKSKDEAVKQYQVVVNLSPSSDLGDLAKAGLTRLGIVID